MKSLEKQVLNMSPRGFLLRLLASLALFNLFTVGLASWTIWQQFDLHHEQADVSTQNLVLALGNELRGQIDSQGMALYAVQDEFYRQRAGGRVDARALNAYIEKVRSRLPGIDAIRITDDQGMLVYGTEVKSETKTSLADRPHFIRLHADATAGLVISKPQISRINNKAVIALARRLEYADGRFAGMVFAAVPLGHLTRTFSHMEVGEHGVVAMRDDELAMVARFPESSLSGFAVGSKNAAPELQRLVRAGHESGTYRTDALADKIERTISFRKVGDYPFYLVVGRASVDYLADARLEAKKIVALVAAFALVSLILAGIAYRSWRRQHNLNQSLQESETRLNELFENMSSGVAVYRASDDGQDFVFSGLNRSAEKLEKLRREDVLGKRVIEVFPGVVELGLLDVFRRVWKTGVGERFPLSFYHDGRISGWRDNFVYKLPSGEIVAIYDDVTERMQAQQSLSELNRDFMKLLESTTDFIYFKDKDSRLRFCSQTLADITGHKSWRDMIGKHDLEIFPADTARIYYEEELPVFRDGTPILNRIDPYYDEQGKQGWVSTNKWPVFDSDGKTVIGIFGISRDISEFKRAEIALRRSEELFRTITDSSPLAIYMSSGVEQRAQYVNPTFVKLFGYEMDEVPTVAQWWPVAYPDEAYRNKIAEEWQRRSAYAIEHHTEIEPMEVSVSCKDGSQKVISWGFISTGDQNWAFGLDLTERKKFEESLIESEARLRTIIQNEPECIKIVDSQGRLTQMNPAGLAMIEAESLEQVAGIRY